MNLVSSSTSAGKGPEGLESDVAGGDPAQRQRPPLETGLSGAGSQSTVLEARIGSLKILALSILREIESLEAQAGNSPLSLDLQTEVHRFEAALIRSALIRTGGRQRRAARLLGMKVTTLNTKIKRYQIRLDEFPIDKGLPTQPTSSVDKSIC